jgi:hypothetical protein
LPTAQPATRWRYGLRLQLDSFGRSTVEALEQAAIELGLSDGCVVDDDRASCRDDRDAE